MKILNKIIFAVLLSTLFMGCKKDEPVAPEDVISYAYNGNAYEIKAPSMPKGRFQGISLGYSEVFGGDIFYGDNSCAYLVPTGTFYEILSGCQLSFPQGLGDSSRLYVYHSGNLSYAYSACEDLTDLVTGIAYTQCTVTGSFSLMLINNQNQYITISNGMFTLRKVLK